MRSGQGNPDEARAARYVLKDYANAKLLFCHPPPDISEDAFNEQTHQNSLLRAAGKKRAPVTRVRKGADTFVPSNTQPDDILPVLDEGHKSMVVDRDFFAQSSVLSSRPFIQGSSRKGQAFSRAKLYPHQNAVADDGTPLGRVAVILANAGGDGGKKHYKKNKRVKQRSGKGYD
jgi:large subunit GTPase 1